MTATTELPMKALSPTKIDAAMQCPTRFKYRYVDRLPEPSSGILHAGIVFHDAMEFAQRAQMLGKPLPSHKDVDDRYLAKWEDQKKETEESDKFVTWEYNDGDPEETVKRQTRELVKLAHTDLLPHIKPKLVEEKLYFDVDRNGSGPFRVYGRIDYLDTDLVLADWKTAKDKVSRFADKAGTQLACYGVWHNEYTGAEVMHCKKIFMVRRAKKHKIEVRKYTVTSAYREWAKDAAAEVWKMVKGGGYPMNVNGWWCSQKFCSFYDFCRGEVSSV
jgi:CRISPR/Cas system-associated exonuclease Cas4 (RecB family)